MVRWELRLWQSIFLVTFIYFGVSSLVELILEKVITIEKLPGMLFQAFFFGISYNIALLWMKRVGVKPVLITLSLVALVVVTLAYIVVLFYARGR
jgi:uncharacterized membrane protein YadS